MPGGQSRPAGRSGGPDPRVEELCTAVSRLRRELAAHPADLRDRTIAEDELAALYAMVSAGVPEVPRMRRSLLLVAGAVGSVSALAPALARVRHGIELFGSRPEQRTGERAL
ncbi:DUF5955 family protein [Streptomyces xinghaiensis]|uniref:DUF5955 family protein n=1 Tax=Streptomyces xinghaiensis TaxID=1038928 RepID=UPI003449B7EF